MDVVFALVIWRAFTILPRPGEDGGEWSSIPEMLRAEHFTIIAAVLVIVIVIVYWLKNNELYGYLQGADKWVTTLAILQLFAILLFMYAIRLGIDYPDGAAPRVAESVAAMLIGVPSFLAWWRAMRVPGLIKEDVSPEKKTEILFGNLAEPLTALVTIPCAFIGPIGWQIGWLTYPLMLRLVKRLAAG